ncbi:type VI secretion system protein ImpK [Paraburkholderia sp. CI2]|uniref:DotU family type IV/VI secretion system protein n=1 Tax=unclassified Paraburkholderia TaxID=2615204 RepID=UPI00160D91ED|nr:MULTISPECIES: DotU family type IV/VI secretion system protein [unclassified Paraburkholderia]MBB5464376.1 type VI secretion system protein ImpK [Paraburkholderia sp. CI2]MBC8735371.1 DotU family type IV/VI secretion system protein [Paraburkholderia sp. UCT31]
MNALPRSPNEAALLDSAPGATRASREGIRDLLRDTALLVTTLTPGGHAGHAIDFRNRCAALIANFSTALERRGYPDDVRREALLAQCGLLDEVALRYLPPESRAGWELKPLQVELFNLHDAGERVFERLEARMREASPHIELLECYAAILSLGLIGRFARDGEAKRTALTTALHAQLEKLRPAPARTFIADRPGRRLSDWFYRLSPWAIAGLACVVAAIVWLVWSALLDSQLAQLAHAKPTQP